MIFVDVTFALCTLSSVKPKKDEGDSDEEEKKAGVSKPSLKLTEGDSPNSVVQPKKSGKPRKDKGDAADKEKKAGVSDSSSKPTKGDSPDSVVKQKKGEDDSIDEE
jgi:hypothetical protein